MPVRGPMLLHRMALVSFRLFCKNLGNLQEFFGQMVYRPPWPKIARTPMGVLPSFFPGSDILSYFEEFSKYPFLSLKGVSVTDYLCMLKEIKV